MNGGSMKNRIGVLMPVYNAEPYIKEAIDSILNQTYSNFDFYIINDGSSDKSDEIIRSYTDERIHYLVNDQNRGLVYTLNRGLDLIENEFIARMDNDDIAFPDRFEKQLKFMDSHQNIVACGSQVQYFGTSDIIPEYPLNHDEIKARFITANAIVHPTAFIRSEFINEQNIRYDEEHTYLEDYNFWLDVSRKGKLANHPEILLKYRWHGQNMTAEGTEKRQDRYKKIYHFILEELGIEPTEERKQLHLELSLRTKSIQDVSRLYRHIQLILSQNKDLNIYPQKELKIVLEKLWDKIFFKVRDSGLRQTFRYWKLRKGIKVYELKYALSKLFRSN